MARKSNNAGVRSVKPRNVVSSHALIPVRIVFKMSMHRHKSLSLSGIANIIGESRPRTAYHLPRLVRDGVLIKKGDAYHLQDHFYHMEDYLPLIVPLMKKIADNMEGEFEDPENAVVQNVIYFLTNVSLEVE